MLSIINLNFYFILQVILLTDLPSRLAIAQRVVELLAWTETMIERLPSYLFHPFRAVYVRVHNEALSHGIRDKSWFLWKHLLRHGTARDYGYMFWP